MNIEISESEYELIVDALERAEEEERKMSRGATDSFERAMFSQKADEFAALADSFDKQRGE